MYVCMYVCIYVCMYVCIYVCMYVCTHLCIYVSMYLSIYLSVCLSIYLPMYLSNLYKKSQKLPFKPFVTQVQPFCNIKHELVLLITISDQTGSPYNVCRHFLCILEGSGFMFSKPGSQQNLVTEVRSIILCFLSVKTVQSRTRRKKLHTNSVIFCHRTRSRSRFALPWN